MCRDVTDGLVTLHSHSVVHGDIKGDNVLVFKLSTGPEAPILDMDGSHLEGTTADIPNQGILLSRVFLRQRLDRDWTAMSIPLVYFCAKLCLVNRSLGYRPGTSLIFGMRRGQS